MKAKKMPKTTKKELIVKKFKNNRALHISAYMIYDL
jgi:hypothetical protein